MPIDFELTEEQKLLQNSVRDFAKKEFTRERAMECDRKSEFPMELYKKCWQQGFLGATWAPEYGGQGLSWLENMIILFEMHKAEPTLASAIYGGIFGTDVINYFGTPEQKSKWLLKIASGEITSAGCFSEPGGGSDIARVLDTRAVKDGDTWIINGSKTFITNAITAGIFVVLVQTDVNAKPPYRGKTTFLVERGPGVETTLMKGKMGWHASPTGDLFLTDVRVKETDIVGGPANLNRGFYMALSSIDDARLGVGTTSIATAEAALEKTIAYAKERDAFGRKIGGFQGLAFRIMEMATKVELAKSMVFRAAWLRVKSRQDKNLMNESIRIASMLKWYGARLAVEACDLLVDVYGGTGYFTEEDVSRWYTFAKVNELIEGTKEIQKNAIARIMLGDDICKTF
jgi:acyl-CoA dehydrogenase